MKLFTSNKREPYFSDIISGRKIVEGRLYKGKWIEMLVGDVIEVDNSPESDTLIKVEIIDKKLYKGFYEMIESEGLKNVIPDAMTIEQAVSEYRKFYTIEDETNFGVSAIKIKIIQ